MSSRLALQVEIETLHELLDELDYYRILRLPRTCTAEEVGQAFRKESRRLHPDRVAAIRDPAIQRQANAIYRLVGEAYRCLKDPERRARYDQLLDEGQLRMTDEADAAAQADRHRGDPEYAAHDPKAEKYWKMALRDFRDENFGAAVMNIQFALNFEPDNEVFKEWLDKARAAKKEADAKKEKNPYKLRIG